MIRIAAATIAATLIVLFAVVFPWALDAALARFGIRVTAAAAAVLVAVALPLRSRAPAAGPVGALGIAALLLGAATTGDPVFLRLAPAWIYVGMAWAAASSLRGGSSLIEQGARFLVPEAPAFIGPYCRVVTALWAVFFVTSGLVIAALAIAAPADAWRTFTGRTVWGVMAVLCALEFFVRKTWFRYYFRGGPFDRFWSLLFPAERTERGRRSMEAIRSYREQQRRDEASPRGAGPPTEA